MNDLASERLRLFSLLTWRRFGDSAPCVTGRKATAKVVGGQHFCVWDPPAFAQPLVPDPQPQPVPSVHIIRCFYGCGWETIVQLTGEEIWQA